jgi:hypothetical protein
MRTLCVLAAALIVAMQSGCSKAERNADPDEVLRRFLAAMQTSDEAEIRATTIADPDVWVLWNRGPASSSEKFYLPELVSSSKFEHLKIGDELHLRGKTIRISEADVNDHCQQIRVSGTPLPITVVKGRDGWKVDAGPIIAGRKAPTAVRAK